MPRVAGRGLKSIGSIGAAVLLVLILASCGGASARKPRQHHGAFVADRPSGPFAAHGSPARIPPARAVAMTPTPRAELAFCRKNIMLRPVCPRRMPAWSSSAPQGRQEYYCQTADPHETSRETVTLFPSNRCVFAEWGYELVAPLPGLTAGKRVSAWDGIEWLVPQYAPLEPPPWHVHIDIVASVGSSHPLAGGAATQAQGAHRVTDALLNPSRSRAVSLGWVRWYGKNGQLVLAPTNVNGGLWAGHLIFYFTDDDVDYAITLHAWTSILRISGGGVNRVDTFQSGPALPRVIATLRDIVGSALGRQ
jgi:hypothetical protein